MPRRIPAPDVEYDDLLTPREVAAIFRVNPKTVSRWYLEGKLPALRTLGGHRRYRRRDVDALLASHTDDAVEF
jgi:excisionase family DNA binding protein